MTSTEQLVADRRETHGRYDDHARITQTFKMLMEQELAERSQRGQAMLSYTQKESLDMILHKIGRIIAGEASFPDHWDDIAGYAKIANGVD